MLKCDLSNAELAGDKFLVVFIAKPVTPLFHSPIFLTSFILKFPVSPSVQQLLKQSRKLPKSRTRLQRTYQLQKLLVHPYVAMSAGIKFFHIFLKF
jgi:hypothetical protein